MNREKPCFQPEEQDDVFLLRWPPAEEAQDERAPDPLDRPDLLPLEPEEDGFLAFDPFWGCAEPVPCPCCGAEYPAGPCIGDICPVCWWELDPGAEVDPAQPSDQNHGLSLDEARMNFRAFGICDPALWDAIKREIEGE